VYENLPADHTSKNIKGSLPLLLLDARLHQMHANKQNAVLLLVCKKIKNTHELSARSRLHHANFPIQGTMPSTAASNWHYQDKDQNSIRYKDPDKQYFMQHMKVLVLFFQSSCNTLLVTSKTLDLKTCTVIVTNDNFVAIRI
jgi:hypothetical protein